MIQGWLDRPDDCVGELLGLLGGREIDGVYLPDDVRESYLLHNGTGWLLYFGEVMPLEGGKYVYIESEDTVALPGFYD